MTAPLSEEPIVRCLELEGQASLVDIGEVKNFFQLLFSDLPGYLPIVTLPGASSQFFPTNELNAAAIHTAERAALADVFMGCCTLDKRPTRGRGGAGDTLALPGLWCDIDIAGGHHHQNLQADGVKLPGNLKEALNFLDVLDSPPTCVVHSGGGVHAWWLFNKPLVFTSTSERVEAAHLSRTFGSMLVALGKVYGWHVDDVSDLARILRPPGSVNRKREPVPVRVLRCARQNRYTPDYLESVIATNRPNLLTVSAQQPKLGASRKLQDSPAEAFSRIVSWEAILGPAGFEIIQKRGEVAYWHHPASATGPASVSATTDAQGAPVVVVFSESAAAITGLPSGSGHRLTKFRAWCLLNFGGDEREAAQAIRRMGRRAR